MADRNIKFSFSDTPELRNTSYVAITSGMVNRTVYAIQRWGVELGRDVTLGDIIDNWSILEYMGIRGFGVGVAKNIRAAFFAYMVNGEKSDSVKILLEKEVEEYDA